MTHRVAVTFVVASLAAVAAQNSAGAQKGVARIMGVAVHPDGTPGIGAVEVEPVVDPSNPTAAATIAAADGSFATEKLPPGRYRLGVDLGIDVQPDEAYGRTYYPGTADPAKAAEIEIGPGIPETRILFTLPPKRPLVQMRGRVVFADGTPAPGVDVLFSPVGGYSTGQLWTDSTGKFSEGRYGSVAYRIRSRTHDRKYASVDRIIAAEDLEKPIVLVLREISKGAVQGTP